jgi:hypothetical protein
MLRRSQPGAGLQLLGSREPKGPYMVSRAHESLCYVGERARSRAALSADFYVRRARRLFPALAVVLATCLLLGWFVLLPAEPQSLGKHIGAATAFYLVWRCLLAVLETPKSRTEPGPGCPSGSQPEARQ